MPHPADEHHKAGREWCYYIPPDGYVEGFGWRVSMVFDGVTGHIPIGVHPWTPSPDNRIPLFFGHDYDEACTEAARQNWNLDADTKPFGCADEVAPGLQVAVNAARERCARKCARMVEAALRE